MSCGVGVRCFVQESDIPHAMEGTWMRVLAGIVLYNPDLQRLRENISAIRPQVDEIIFVDNGSAQIGKIREELALQGLDTGSCLIENGCNLGIAAALNQILAYAGRNGFEWFITMDQDSVCEPGLVDKYRGYADLPDAGILTCRIVDRNFVEKPRLEAIDQPVEIDSCITSASFCNEKAVREVGGFDEKMFIDSVDFEICVNLRNHGYKVYRVPFTGLLHEVGHGKNVRLFLKKQVVYNHSALRNYYIARNHLYMAKKYPQEFPILKMYLKELETRLLILLYENDKRKKLRARRQGFRDARKGKMGKCEPLF